MIRRWLQRLQSVGHTAVEAPEAEDSITLPQPVLGPDSPIGQQHLVSWIKTLVPAAPNLQAHEAVVMQLLDGLATTALPSLDYDMRWNASWRTHTWDSLSIAEAEALIAGASDSVTVAAGLSMHRNGRIREVAVKALDQCGSERALRWLVLRCGDWVAQVRDRARSAIDRWLAPSYAKGLIDSLPLLDGGRFSTGRAHSDLRPLIVSVLNDPTARETVTEGARSQSRPVRRASVRVLLENGADPSLLQQVMATGDVVAISMVAAKLPTTGSANRAAGELMLQSPMARFRSEGLWRLTKDDDAGSEDLAESALVDRAPSVRGVAQLWLSARGHDHRHHYRSLVASDPVPALRGLADRPAPQDADLARSFVDHSTGPQRLEALRLLAGLGNRADGALFADRLLTGTAKERRYALAGLRRLGPVGFIDDMWARAQADDDPRLVERVIYQVLPHTGRWKRIDIGLQAIASPNPATCNAGFEALGRALIDWNRGYPGCPPDLDLLRQRLDDARPTLANADHSYGRSRLLDTLESILRPSDLP